MLIERARRVAQRAYAPYSGFRVGAVVVANGRSFEGVNVENASYGLTLCAERVALFSAVSAGCRSIATVALSCLDAPAEAAAAERLPCGACRQVLAELASADTPVWIDGVGERSVGGLLPEAFVLPKA